MRGKPHGYDLQFESEIEVYFKDVRNILDEQFNHDDETQGIQRIFDKRQILFSQ